ncbi:MAG: hypothetical protein LUQ35_05565 [Methanoregula sp.]|nr:hypothetical protein [Methanoregula sp.]
MESKTHRAGSYRVTVFGVAALVFLLLIAGCTTQPAPVPVTTTPPTTVQTPVATMTAIPTPTATLPDPDKAFTDAADICYQKTPVITNLTTHLEFATCMKDTPLPPGNCAQNFRYYVLKSTNEDASTAGFARETNTARLARQAFLRGEGYDGIRQEYVPCGNATLITTSFYK